MRTFAASDDMRMRTNLVDGVGLWMEQRKGAATVAASPAFFLDRDGVIVEETHYLGRPDDVRIIASAPAAIRAANALGFPVVIVTNQAGIGRGYYDWAGFAAVQDRIVDELAAAGARVDLTLACAYHEAGDGPFKAADHPWRKPNPGMLLAAAECLQIDLARSIIVGDKVSDLEAGRRAGLMQGILVLTGHGTGEAGVLSPGALAPMRVAVAADLGGALAEMRAQGWPQAARSALTPAS